MHLSDHVTRRWTATVGLGLSLALWSPRLAQADATEPLELENPLVPADQCEYCHSFNNAPEQAADPMYAPVFTWKGSMMANSAVDPVFWAGVAIASQDAVVPEETAACVRCHAPRAFLEGRGSAISLDELSVHDRAGVECEVCHRMVADELPANAHYTLDDVLVGEEVPRRGPWDYADITAEVPIPAPPHEALFDTFIGSSEMCGTCHDVTTDRERVDARGVGQGVGFNEQRTYSEWAGSAYAAPGPGFASCQDCHMPAVEDAPGCRDYVTIFSHPEGARRHDTLGANRFVMELLAEDAGIFDSIAFNYSLGQIDEFLRTSASLEVSGPPEVHMGEGLADLAVTVTNNTGHKLPTGYSEGRVMWLEVSARLGEQEIWSSGVWDADRQELVDDPQLRTYEGVAVEQSTGERFHLLRNNYWSSDTRIPPLGLVADPETDPQTDRYPMLPDGTWANYDEHEYAFEGRPELEDPTPDDSNDDQLEVTVRLLYLVNTRSYVQFLDDENSTNNAGSELARRFDAAGGAVPLVLAEQSLSVPVTAFGEPVAASTGADSTAGESSSSSPASSSEGGTEPPPVGTTGGASSTGTSTDGGGADGDDSGCSCRSNRPLPGPGLLLLMLGAPWLRRRRRAL